MGAIASQITSLAIVYLTVYSGADPSKHQSPASLAFVWGIHRGPVNSPHKGSVTRKMFLFDDVIMETRSLYTLQWCHDVIKDQSSALLVLCIDQWRIDHLPKDQYFRKCSSTWRHHQYGSEHHNFSDLITPPRNVINISSGKGLWPDDIKPLPAPTLT